MLSRLGVAITQFIRPIASAKDTAIKRRHERNADSASGGKSQDSSQNQSNNSDKNFKRDFPPAATLAPVIPLPVPGDLSVTSSFIRLLTRLQLQRGQMLKWFGLRAYQAVMKNQRKTAKVRKGTMLDLKAG